MIGRVRMRYLSESRVDGDVCHLSWLLLQVIRLSCSAMSCWGSIIEPISERQQICACIHLSQNSKQQECDCDDIPKRQFVTMRSDAAALCLLMRCTHIVLRKNRVLLLSPLPSLALLSPFEDRVFLPTNSPEAKPARRWQKAGNICL